MAKTSANRTAVTAFAAPNLPLGVQRPRALQIHDPNIHALTNARGLHWPLNPAHAKPTPSASAWSRVRRGFEDVGIEDRPNPYHIPKGSSRLTPKRYTYSRYLRSKRTVDDRALNRGVMQVALEALPTDRPARIAELGGGVGTMVDRLIGDGGLSEAEYLLVDAEPEFLEEVRAMVPRWKEGATRDQPPRPGVTVDVSTREGRLEDWLRETDATFDLIVVHAVLDLVDVRDALPLVLDRLADDGVLWTTINFDGDTIFEPKDPRDDELLAAYHASMDARTGSSTAGRELFGHVRGAGGTVLRAGSSDWVVFDDGSGYVGDEAYFVHHILHTIESELEKDETLRAAVRSWGQLRHEQVDRGELVYIAHQLDFAIRR